MSKLIKMSDVSDNIEKLRHYIETCPLIEKTTKDIVKYVLSLASTAVEAAPAVDAEPVRRGYWIVQNEGRTRFKCSACGSENHDTTWPYCSHCGAAMSKKKEGDDGDQ